MGDEADPSGGKERQEFIASRWEREVAEEFLRWRSSSGFAVARMTSFAAAIEETVSLPGVWAASPSELALTLSRALASCDQLEFRDDAEVLAYASLHLLDRYGRVTQVLEHLLTDGRLPIRRRGVKALEIGAGPAPALYAARDFYADLVRWPGRGDVEVTALSVLDPLDRGSGWDRFLHRLSEQLGVIRSEGLASAEGALPFARSSYELSGFDIGRRHHEAVALAASHIQWEFDIADEPLSRGTAFRLAYEDGVVAPSAYDLIFVPYFLTQPTMIEEFEVEVRRLMQSLTPGGLFIVLTAVSHTTVQRQIAALAARQRLTDVGPQSALEANSDLLRRTLVNSHVQRIVGSIRDGCTDKEWEVAGPLPKQILAEPPDNALPRFHALVFANHKPPRGGAQAQRRRSSREKPDQ